MKTRLPAAVVVFLALAAPICAEEPISLDRIETVCLETILQNCKVLTAGFLNVDWGDDEGAPLLAWQTQAGFTPEDGVLGGFVLLHHVDGNWARLDAWLRRLALLPTASQRGRAAACSRLYRRNGRLQRRPSVPVE